MGRFSDQQYSDEVSERIHAPSERLYELVSDLPKMGRFSPENKGGRWLGRAKGPRVGARFLGFNRRGPVVWTTISKVVVASPGEEFAFDVKASGARWRYRFQPEGDATVVTEVREPLGRRPMTARLFAGGLLGGIAGHDDEMRDGMQATLSRLKAAAESS